MKRSYPRWLCPRTTDLLPFTSQQIGAHIMNGIKFRGLDEFERATKLREIGAMGARAARTASTPEQRKEWAIMAGKIGNAKRWAK